MSQVVFKRAIVTNIDTDATTQDLEELLGLNKTDFLKNNSCVQIKKDDNNGIYALIISPQVAHDEFIKLNGIEFYGKNLKIVSEDVGTPTNDNNNHNSNNNSSSSNNVTQDDGEILYMLLDCRNHPDLNFPPVSEVEVCDALLLDHSDDEHKAVKKFWGRNLGTYGIESTDMERYVDSNVVIRGHTIKLEPVRRKQKKQIFRDPDGIKIRIFDAYGLQFRGIHGGLFDDYFDGLGVEVIKQTRPERCRDRPEVFNTNRFIVVKKTNHDGIAVDFGSRITVSGHSFKLSYFGMRKFCDLCNGVHRSDYCPSQVRFAFLKQLRKGKTQKRKIYSDSTLRHTNQLALTTDVACMSGGGLGQICNLVPFDEQHNDIIINAGTNEIKNEQPLKEFVYTVESAGEKLKELSKTVPITVVLPPTITTTPELKAKSEYLQHAITTIDEIKTIQLNDIETANNDPHFHPTVAGTKEMIVQINDAVDNEIILPQCEDDTTLPTKYRQVQPLFKTGCRGCNTVEYTPTLCSSCKDKAKDVDTKHLTEKIEMLRQQMYPTMGDIQMKDLNKRPLSPDVHDDGKVPKSAKASSD